jgi:hypothetical protein
MDEPKYAEGISPLTRRLWIVSALISLACLIVLASIWYRAYTALPSSHPDDTVMTTRDEVTRYLAAYVPASENGGEPPVFIPTGLYIQSIEFKGSYNVLVSGYIWQRYANDLPQGLDRGVVMPEAEAPTFNQVYRVQQGNEELIGWSFRATLRQQFDYSSSRISSSSPSPPIRCCWSQSRTSDYFATMTICGSRYPIGPRSY